MTPGINNASKHPAASCRRTSFQNMDNKSPSYDIPGNRPMQLKPCKCLSLFWVFVFLLITLTTDKAVAAIPSTAGSAPYPYIEDKFDGLPFISAMGGREDAALKPGGAESGSLIEQALGGSFLGSLLFGFPYEGVGTFDFVVIAVLFFLIIRTMQAQRRQKNDRFSTHRRENPNDSAPRSHHKDQRSPLQWPKLDNSGGSSDSGQSFGKDSRNEARQKPDAPKRPANVQDNAAAMWARLSSNQEQQIPQSGVAKDASIPKGFDVQDFLEGARTLYVKLQTAWAARKLDDLLPFTTPQMMAMLQKQAVRDPNPTEIAIVFVNASLQDVSRAGGLEQATVLFDVTMRTSQAVQAEQIQEKWLFVRGTDTDGMWKLASIEQA